MRRHGPAQRRPTPPTPDQPLLDVSTTEAFVILFLVGLSAVFSGMETALVSLSEVKLRSRLEGDDKAPKMLELWLHRPNDVLATLLVGNNVVNITGSALATAFTEKMLQGSAYAGWGIPIAVGCMTLLVLIAGEIIPKTFAKHHPERFLKALPVIHLTYVVTYPFTMVLVRLTSRVVQGLGGSIQDGPTVTEEDIEELVRIGRQDGSIPPEATRLLTGVLELDEKVAREIMVPRTDMQAISVDTSLDDAFRQVASGGFSRYPVYEGSVDKVVGVLYIKDLFSAVAERIAATEPVSVSIADVMRPPMIRPSNIGLQRLLIEMKRDRVHIVILASEYGGVEGLVTLEDIVEEVFGPIYDEHDLGNESIHTLPDGTWLVDGICTMSELENELGVEFAEDEDYETVNGLLMKASGTVPEQGFMHEQEGWRFEVLSSDSTRVLEVRLSRVSSDDLSPSDDAPADAPTTVANGNVTAEPAARDFDTSLAFTRPRPLRVASKADS